MGADSSCAALECDIILWLKALFPRKPNAVNLVRFFPHLDIVIFTSIASDFVDRGLIESSAISIRNGKLHLDFNGVVLTAKGYTYAQELALNGLKAGRTAKP